MTSTIYETMFTEQELFSLGKKVMEEVNFFTFGIIVRNIDYNELASQA